MAARYVATSRLSNIVQMITLARQSGILRVMRGQGQAREMGQIRFVAGEPASVLFGNLTGQNALNVLMNWGECVYSFDETASLEDMDSGYGEASPLPYSGPMTGSWPSYGYSSPSGYPAAPSPLPGESMPTYPGFTQNYPTGYPGSAPQPADPYGRPPAPQVATTSIPAMPALRPEVLGAVPYRTVVADQVDQLPLDRRERMVLLLVDGQRSLADLSRLTRRTEREVYAVLQHLNLLGLIQFRGA